MKCVKVLLGILALGFLVSAGVFTYVHFKSNYTENKDLEIAKQQDIDLVDKVVLSTEDNANLDTESNSKNNFDLGFTIDWDYLHEVNTDIIAWVYIPNTYISFPLLQEQVLLEYYYLNHDYKREYLQSGSLFTPAEPLGVEDAHTLIFGHHTKKKDVVFSDLYGLFSSHELGNSNPTMYILYPDRIEEWTLWCANVGHQDDSVYEIPYLIGTDSYAELLDSIENTSLYQYSEPPTKDENIVVLSTCNGQVGGVERFYVSFKRSR